ncbi:Nramp family divalent metal transporter [Albibacterium indicum]|uniref:Nramp family divalent metal transporter n=1 Tax=Albibacterium indicum TaxID=2292082 RepID=UPI000E522532|nr:Nramp family divalent metal transporter [Pedobacter indicus]
MNKPKTKNPLIKWLLSLGPGIITAALVFGPSKITITTKLGAVYGYSLLWIVAVAILFMAVFTNIGERIGLADSRSLLTIIREKWSKAAAVIIGIGIFLVATSFQAGNSVGVGIAVAEASATSTVTWIVVFNLIGIFLLFFRKFYGILEKLMILLVSIMLFSFVTTLFFAKPDIAGIVQGFAPSIPLGSEGLVIAFIASCFSITGAFYQAYLVQERKRKGIIDVGEDGQHKKGGSGSLTGIIILGIMSAVVLICAAAVLNPQGISVTSASDMAKALEPLFGVYASDMFLVGLFGASFSSLVGNATLGGTLLSDALGYGSKLDSPITRVLIGLVMVCGSLIAILFGKLPLELIVFAQSITIFLVPFIGVAMFSIANRKDIMGIYVNKGFSKIIGGLGLVVLLALAIYNVYDMFLK